MPILTDEERLGTTLAGRYRLDRILGRGGMGVVYAGEHTWSKRKVAVKLLLGELARDPAAVQRFVQEARTAAALEHPNVVQVLDVGQAEDGAVFMAQELLRGRTLADLLDARGRLSVEETLELLLPVMDALAVAHDAGIVHRDLKPENVFLAEDATGRVVPKLLDFGIAKVAQGGLATMTGTMVGSPAYMSPEQAECRKDVGPQTDQWSMGVVLYRCLSGEFPFDFPPGASPATLLAAVLTRPTIPLRDRKAELPGHTLAAIDRALAKAPATRHPGMRAFQKALRAEASGVSATVLGARPPLPPTVASTTVAAVGSLPPTRPSSTGTQMWTPPPERPGTTPFAWQDGAPPKTDTRPRSGPIRPIAVLGAGAVLLIGTVAGAWALRDVRAEPGSRGSESAGSGARTSGSSASAPAPPRATTALDAGTIAARLTGPVLPPPGAEPLLPPAPTLATPSPPLEASPARRSRRTPRGHGIEPALAPASARPSPPVLAPRPRAAPVVIDNGIRIPD